MNLNFKSVEETHRININEESAKKIQKQKNLF